MNQHIEQAIDNFRRSAVRYAKTERYYRGDHDLAFATEKFENAFGTLFREFAMNLCPAICDAVKDKLRISGFGVNVRPRTSSPPARGGVAAASADGVVGAPASVASDADPAPPSEAEHASSLRSQIDHIWFRNRMQQRAGEIHKEALKNGDAFAIVWFDERGEVTIYPHRAANVTVHYDEDLPGRMAWAAKYWRTADRHTRLNLFFPDRIERFVTQKEFDAVLPDASEFVTLSPKSNVKGPKPNDPEQPWTLDIESWTLPNPFGVVPVFHFANNSDVGCLGQSELAGAIPIQDGLNKSILDMLVAMEFSAFRQRWASGLEVDYDDEGEAIPPFKTGVDRLWMSTNPQTTFGEFNTTNLEQFLKVKDSFRVDMASVTGTPLHYFLQTTRSVASGESLKQNETRFLAKVRDRQTAFGQTWAELMSFALRLNGSPDVELITHWEDPAPSTERDTLQNLLLKKRLGVSTEQALREAGYGEIDVRQMTK